MWSGMLIIWPYGCRSWILNPARVSYKVALKKINNNKRLLSVLIRAYLQGKRA